MGRGGGGAAAMRSQCVLGLRSFAAFAARLWSFVLYVLRRQVRTVSTGGAPGGLWVLWGRGGGYGGCREGTGPLGSWGGGLWGL